MRKLIRYKERGHKIAARLGHAGNASCLVLAACLIFSACPPPVPHGGERIAGRVRNARTGLAVAGIDLDVFDAAGQRVTVQGGTSGADGRYTIALPGPGTYTVRADASHEDGLVDLYFDQVFPRSQAQPIEVAADAAVTGVDFMLFPGADITGSVRAAATDAGLAGIDLDLFSEDGGRLDSYLATTQADGSYAIGALPPGTYYVRADPSPAKDQFFLDAFYGGGRTLAEATSVVVAESGVAQIDIALDPAGSIAGSITDAATGQGVAGIDLDVFDALGERSDADAVTDANGNYETSPIPPGSYVLRADPGLEQGYVRTYYPDAPRQPAAEAITVTAGARTSGINLNLPLGGSLAGQVTDLSSGSPLAGIDIDVFDAAGVRLEQTGRTDAEGRYQVGALAPDLYVVRVDPGIEQGYPRTYYPNAYNHAAALSVSVAAGNATSGLDFALPLGGTIGGAISAASSGAPLAAVDIDCFDAAGSRVDLTAMSALDGTFLIGTLAPGVYLLRADPAPAQGYATQFYLEKNDAAFADAIAVVAGAGTPGVNFSLEPATWIEGTVHDALGEPLPGVDLDLYDAATGIRLGANAITQTGGAYRFDNLPAGQYKLRCDPADALGYANRYFDGKTTRDEAAAISTAAGAGVSGVDFAIEADATISGRVTDGTNGVADIDIDLFEADTLFRLDQTARTGPDGAYTVAALPPGRYVLRADPAPGQPYRRTYYGGTTSPQNATALVVTAGEHVAQIDIMLYPARKGNSRSVR